jgi:hypothetical protein
MNADLTLPRCPLWLLRAVAALAASTVLLVAPSPAVSEAGGDQHHVFNPAAKIDQSQVIVRGTR